jgi:hypothetical protein
MAEHRFQTPGPVELVIGIPTGEIDIETVEGDEAFVTLDGDEKLIDLTEVRQEGRRQRSPARAREGAARQQRRPFDCLR